MKRYIAVIVMTALLAACSYEENIELCDVGVQLVYPDNTVSPYKGARVQLKNSSASIFVDSTDAGGTAHFLVPSGIYEASSSETYVTYDYRYFFNGVKSLIIVSPDSTNRISMKLTVSKKRIVH